MSLDQGEVTAPRLEVRNLSRRFGDRLVVDDVSVTIAPGQVTCLLGPSGCGKSTTLRMIAGVDMPDGGVIKVDGETIQSDHLHLLPEQRNIGLMFQDFALFPHLSVAENVAFGLKGKRDNSTVRVDELLTRIGLLWAKQSYPHVLSGGEQQRVALARALAPRPRIMLMDEPFSGLDNRLRDEIRDETLSFLKDEDTAVLLVTHDPEEALRMADEVALMRDGRIVQKGTPLEIYNSPNDIESMRFFSDINVIKGAASKGRVKTIFGDFDATNLTEGGNAAVAIRPQHVQLDFFRDGSAPTKTKSMGVAQAATVLRARFVGGQSLIELQLHKNDAQITAKLANVFLPKVGETFWVTLPRSRCQVFSA